MFETTVDFKADFTPQEQELLLMRKLSRGTARAADVINGALKRFSARDLLHARTGNLARNWSVEGDDKDPLAFHIRNPLPYAAILNSGGEIKAKTGKALAIPLQPWAATARGVAKYSSPRDAPAKLFVWKSKRGNAFLAEATEKKLRLWYLLRDKVTMPAFGYADAAIKSSSQLAVEKIADALSK